jgi:hypothetical protein
MIPTLNAATCVSKLNSLGFSLLPATLGSAGSLQTGFNPVNTAIIVMLSITGYFIGSGSYNKFQHLLIENNRAAQSHEEAQLNNPMGYVKDINLAMASALQLSQASGFNDGSEKGNAERAIKATLDDLHTALNIFKQDAELLRGNSSRISDENYSVLTAFQFQDRVSRKLTHVEHNLHSLQNTVENAHTGGNRHIESLNIAKALLNMELNYSMPEQPTTMLMKSHFSKLGRGVVANGKNHSDYRCLGSHTPQRCLNSERSSWLLK